VNRSPLRGERTKNLPNPHYAFELVGVQETVPKEVRVLQELVVEVLLRGGFEPLDEFGWDEGDGRVSEVVLPPAGFGGDQGRRGRRFIRGELIELTGEHT
jgi:hypothetical protein